MTALQVSWDRICDPKFFTETITSEVECALHTNHSPDCPVVAKWVAAFDAGDWKAFGEASDAGCGCPTDDEWPCGYTGEVDTEVSRLQRVWTCPRCGGWNIEELS